MFQGTSETLSPTGIEREHSSIKYLVYEGTFACLLFV